MAIRMRRGNEADFDPSKMLPGEWAVSTDTKYVRMCFSPGIVLRMATYEAFESDMAEIRKILSECQSIQTAVELIQKNVTNSELVIENYVKEAKQYRDEAEQFRNEASMFAPEGYEDLVKNVSNNTVKIDTIIEKAELNIKNNVQGSNIHLTDSAESNVVALELYGKTEQNAYTGKNLFTFPDVYYNGTGLNITKSTDGTYLLNGTSTGAELRFYDGYNSINKRLVVPNGTYKIVATINGEEITSTSTFAVITNGTTYASHYGTSFEITDGFAISSIAVNLTVGKNYTNSELKIMVCKQSEDNVLEPYVGGKPSPSPDYPQEIKSIKGKNLLDCRGLVEQTTNGVTFTPVYDENGNLLYVNANGASTNAYFNLGTVIYPNECVLNGCPTGHSTSSAMLFAQTTDGSKAYFDVGNGIKIPANTEMNIFVRIASGYTANNLKFYPMIRLASIKDDTYVPYGLLRIKTHGINQFDISAPTKENEILNSDGTFSTNGGFNSYRLKLTDTITISYEKDVNFDVLRYGLEIDGVITRYTISGTELTIQKDSADAVWISIAKTNAQKNIMINTGTIALPYQPYQSTEITLSEPIELNGFNGVYDVVTSDGVTRRFAEVMVLSSFDWTVSGGDACADGHCFQTRMYSELFAKNTNEYVLTNALCTHFIIKKASDLYFKSSDEISDGIAIWQNTNGYNVIRCRNTDCSSLDEFKTWLDENEVYLVYELATPTTEALQTDFTVLKTFYPETHVSNDADCDMSITYTADAKNYIDNKIALLTTAIYNNI